MSTNLLGRLVWYDLLTTDPVSAVPFYRSVVGWGTQVMEVGEDLYSMWTVEDQPIGGIMPLPDDAEAPPHWLMYVATPDIESTVRKVDDLGGLVVKPTTDIPDIGRFAVLADPNGAVFATYQSFDAPGPLSPPSPGHFSWHELVTTDLDGAAAFYGAVFGWKDAGATDMGEAGMYHMFTGGGAAWPLGGMYAKPREVPLPRWLMYISVHDVADACERVTDGGGRVEVEPMEVPGGDLIAQCRDPQGASFALHAAATAEHTSDVDER